MSDGGFLSLSLIFVSLPSPVSVSLSLSVASFMFSLALFRKLFVSLASAVLLTTSGHIRLPPSFDLPFGLPRQIRFVRHGQGEHNVAATALGHGCTCRHGLTQEGTMCPYMDSRLTDAALTEEGRKQAQGARQQRDGGWPTVVFTSTLQRALETAVIAFGPEGKGDPKPEPRFVALDELREQSGVHYCDRRRSLAEIRKQFPSVDISRVAEEEDELWHDEIRETKLHLAKRGLAALKLAAAEPAADVAIVTHSSFLLTLFAVVLDVSASPELGDWFATGECRLVVLDLGPDAAKPAAS